MTDEEGRIGKNGEGSSKNSPLSHKSISQKDKASKEEASTGGQSKEPHVHPALQLYLSNPRWKDLTGGSEETRNINEKPQRAVCQLAPMPHGAFMTRANN